jgi:hypothetical protein
MMTPAVLWAYQQRDITATQRFVLVTLALFAKVSADFFVSAQTAIAATGFSERTIRTVLAEFEVRGLIERDGRPWRTRHYSGKARYRAACFGPACGVEPDGRAAENGGA